ncbi:hypothetical protein DFO83_102135 [Idiomarina loihiensis]|uniref:VOC family protein n=1 Tax=Idiomarina TaxID=135575 RepID=UPI000D7109D3|nr:hypothetical protein [Idiomarina]PWW40317.1 hypothetical protein DFO83_102135 [Idiomarina loihiensis]TDP50008.1 hypothetical protein DET58_102131 [Idiomarina loihiensis]TDS24640.1 hypothetical protein DET62_102249 [Idiomarina sp. H2]
MGTYLEHYNVTVSDIEFATEFFLTVFPDFQIRGEGIIEEEIDGSLYKTKWRHVGTESHYLALQSTPNNLPLKENKYNYFNHLGFVVGDINSTLEQFTLMGYGKHRIDDSHPYRTRAYIYIFDTLILELVQYKSDEFDKMNDYAL